MKITNKVYSGFDATSFAVKKHDTCTCTCLLLYESDPYFCQQTYILQSNQMWVSQVSQWKLDKDPGIGAQPNCSLTYRGRTRGLSRIVHNIAKSIDLACIIKRVILCQTLCFKNVTFFSVVWLREGGHHDVQVF